MGIGMQWESGLHSNKGCRSWQNWQSSSLIIRLNSHLVSLHCMHWAWHYVQGKFNWHRPVYQLTLSWNVQKSFNLLNQFPFCVSIASFLALWLILTCFPHGKSSNVGYMICLAFKYLKSWWHCWSVTGNKKYAALCCFQEWLMILRFLHVMKKGRQKVI